MKFEKQKLGNIIKISKGKKCIEIEKPYAKHRYISIEDLHGRNIPKFTNDIGVESQENDILIAWDGANAGKVGTGLKGIIGSTIAKLEINDGNVDSKYLYWYLDSQFDSIKVQRTGATIPHVNGVTLKNIQIPLPPLPEQKRIAAILDKADALRRKDEELLKKYDELAQSIFIDMFGDPVKNEKGWEVKKLGEICDIRRGASPRPINNYIGGTVPWIKIGDGTNGKELYIDKTEVHISKEGAAKSVLLKPGALIFANCGVSLGFARIITIEGCIHDGWLSLENYEENLDKLYLLKYINLLTDYFRRTAPEGTQPNLNTSIMKDHNIIIPNKALQQKYGSIVLKIEHLKEKAILIKDNSSNLFQSLLQQAFKGEL